MINKNIVVMGLACSFLHGTEQTALPVMNDENSALNTSQVHTPSVPSDDTENADCVEKQEPKQSVSEETVQTDINSEDNAAEETLSETDNAETDSSTCADSKTHYQKAASKERKVVFQDDLSELLDLDENCKRHCDRFKQLNIIIQAVNEYHCPRGEKIEVTIENNRWTIVIKNITADLLYECVPIQEFLPETHAKNRLEKYLNLASRYMTKVGIYLVGKTLGKWAKCTVIINGVIHPEEEHILCSDVIIDIVDWSKQKLLNIRQYATDLLNYQIVISKE